MEVGNMRNGWAVISKDLTLFMRLQHPTAQSRMVFQSEPTEQYWRELRPSSQRESWTRGCGWNWHKQLCISRTEVQQQQCLPHPMRHGMESGLIYLISGFQDQQPTFISPRKSAPSLIHTLTKEFWLAMAEHINTEFGI